ncbi:MAG: cardiolipin synthase [Planctomycetota bacterium]
MEVTIFGLCLAGVHLAGLASAWDAIMTGRTPQGTLAWVVSLVTVPYFVLPFYWVFGRRRYRGYEDARREGYGPINDLAQTLREEAGDLIVELPEHLEAYQVLEHLVHMPFTHGNDFTLLLDGDATFDALFEAIERAERYVLVQFFIVRADAIGRELLARLVERARAGVEVCFLYDEVGSRELARSFKRALKAAGGRILPFATTRGPNNRFQLNFRNHRKLVVVDGEVAFLGGINVGDEYLGRGEMGAWRDTFVRLTGPTVQGVQLAFLEDWHWATDEVPEWNWAPRPSESADRVALILPTGPADPLETASLLFITLIQAARDRLWICSPYFVFDHQILGALELAALRGVDVRALIPARSDYRLVRLAGWTSYDELTRLGVRLFEYQEGFLHQKLVLVDDEAVLVGTKNLDNRSLRLNFEISALVLNREFAHEAARVLEADLARCTELPEDALAQKPLLFRFGARAARLFAPIL